MIVLFKILITLILALFTTGIGSLGLAYYNETYGKE